MEFQPAIGIRLSHKTLTAMNLSRYPIVILNRVKSPSSRQFIITTFSELSYRIHYGFFARLRLTRNDRFRQRDS